MKKTVMIISLISILALFILGCTSKAPETVPVAAPLPPIDEPTMEETSIEETAPAEEIEAASENRVEMVSAGFNPKTISISRGETVTFINKDSTAHWPASNLHPTHTTYPGSSIQKCGTADEAATFDACKSLAEGEQYSFTFTRVGTWPYHDHLNPSKSGVIVVK